MHAYMYWYVPATRVYINHLTLTHVASIKASSNQSWYMYIKLYSYMKIF